MNASQKRAVAAHRRRLGEQGTVRYEVRGAPHDKKLVREIAKKLAAENADAARLRAELEQRIMSKPPLSGKDIWEALRHRRWRDSTSKLNGNSRPAVTSICDPVFARQQRCQRSAETAAV